MWEQEMDVAIARADKQAADGTGDIHRFGIVTYTQKSNKDGICKLNHHNYTGNYEKKERHKNNMISFDTCRKRNQKIPPHTHSFKNHY